VQLRVPPTTIACAFGLAAAGLATAAPHGRVVRIERTRPKLNQAPMLCLDERDSIQCLDQPQPRDVLATLDPRGVVGEIVLESVQRNKACTGMWRAKGRVRSGRPTERYVIDRLLDPVAAHQVEVEDFDVEGVSVLFAYARGTGSTPDVVFGTDDCGGGGLCVGTWERMGESYVKVSSLSLNGCE
jgi:hypothetical protein